MLREASAANLPGAWPKRPRTCAAIARGSGGQIRSCGRLMRIFAEVRDDTNRAGRTARPASIAAMQNQPVMRVVAKFQRHELHEFLFDLTHRLARRNARAIGDTKYVSVHRNRCLAKSGIQNDVGSFAP